MPTRKPTPSLEDILNKGKEKTEPEVTETPEPEVTELETENTNDEVVVSDDGDNGPFANPATSSGNPVLVDRPGVSKPELNDTPILVPADESHVHVWQENHDQNLGRLHPDVPKRPLPAEYAQVASTVAGIDYANPAEEDDKFTGTPDDNYTDELI